MELLFLHDNIAKLLTNMSAIFMLISVMVLTGIFKKAGTFGSAYYYVTKYVTNKKLLIFISSLLFQPITPRTFFTAVILRDMAKDKSIGKTKLALFSYIGTHHYYLWSPIETSVIVLMAGLGITYSQFMTYMWPTLLAFAIFLAVFILFFIDSDILKEPEERTVDDISFSKWFDIVLMVALIVSCACGIIGDVKIDGVKLSGYLLCTVCFTILMLFKHKPTLEDVKSFIVWRVLYISLAAVIIGWGIVSYSEPIVAWLHEWLNSPNMAIALSIGFIISFAMGHTGKYAGLTILLTGIFGMKYFPLIYTLELAGFIMSPFHHSIVVVQQYFGAKPLQYYGTVVLLAATLVSVTTAYFVL